VTVTILIGDALRHLRQLPGDSVHCLCTSPPYWRQRDYGVPDQLGLEGTPEGYVAKLTEVFREARRVLRPDGVCWINIGDKWAASGQGGGAQSKEHAYGSVPDAAKSREWRKPPHGYKDKDLLGLPWMLAFALRADGWWLRQCNIWAKPNGMPESTRDRTTTAHEYVLHLTKSAEYWYDSAATRLPAVPESVGRLERAMRASLDAGAFVISGSGYEPPGQPPHQGARRTDKQRGHTRRHAGFNDRWDAMSRAEQQGKGSQLRSVWWLPTANFAEGHFAVMPEELAAICVLAGCPAGGTVLDPFAGAGTTLMVADHLGRDAIGIELNPAFAAMAERRVKEPGLMLDAAPTAERAA
jgi:DNA modification methylase